MPQQRCRGARALTPNPIPVILYSTLNPTPRGGRIREDILGEFMEYVARSPVIGESSSVFVAYLGILTALAQGETGAEVRCVAPDSGKPRQSNRTLELHYG